MAGTGTFGRNSTCVGNVEIDLIPASNLQSAGLGLSLVNSPDGSIDNVGNPRIFPLPNPILNGNRLDFLEQITVPVTDSLTPCASVPLPASQVGVVYCGDNHPKTGTSWSSVVANTVSAIDGGVGSKSVPSPNRMKLEYIPPSIVNDRIVVSPSVEVEELGHPKWQRCIVGHFLDKKLAFTAVQHIAMKIWAKFGIREVLSNDKGFFFFMFEGEKFRQLLESGPWHFWGKLLILKLWHPHLKLEKEQLSQIPLWVHFFNVPSEMWTGPGLSHIASSVGRPLYADHLTESGRRLSFAKICVEVDCSSPLPDSFDLKYANGDVEVIRIQYPWKPQVCSLCQVFGHGDANCPLKVKEMAKETKKATGTNGKNGVVDTNTWQVVGSLRKDAVPGVELRSPVSLQAAIASTSDTGAVMPASISTRNESGKDVSTSPTKNAVLVSAEIGKQPVFMSSGDKVISVPSKFAILDAVGLNMEVGSVPKATALPVATGDGLPDEVTVECAMLDMELVSDFTVVPQSPATPIPPDGKKGGGKGGGNVPAKGGGGKGGRKNKR